MTIKKLYLAGPKVNYPYGLNPLDVETGNIRLPDDGGSGLNEYLLGQSYQLELYPDRLSRDASLGYVNEHIEYIAVSWDRIEEYDISDMAVGPKMHEKGFEEICEMIFPFITFKMFDNCEAGKERADLMIGRVKYLPDFKDGTISVYPVYEQESDEVEERETAMWLMARFRSFVAYRPKSLAEFEELKESLRGQLIRLDAYESSLMY